MKRRDFITLAGGAAAWPVVVRAQQAKVPVVGWLDNGSGSDESLWVIQDALREALLKLGWIEGRNWKLEHRFGADDANRLRAAAAELVLLTPDVIVASNAAATRALQQATQTIPIVFTGGGDAIANGLVKNMARPEGNSTGFSSSEPTAGSKWLELLREAAPGVTRVAIVFNPDLGPTAPNYIASIELAARATGMQTVKVPFHDAIDVVRAIDAFALEANGCLLVLPPRSFADPTIIKLAMQHRLPAIYPTRAFVTEGGLMSYSTDSADQNRRAAIYVDRILRGAKVADLPVQFPTKYQLVVNMKTAKAMGIAVPPMLLARADEIIE